MAKRKSQEHIEGMEPMPKIPKIHNLALKYADKRDEHAKAKRSRDSVHDNLRDAMIEANCEHYVYGDVTVKLKDKKTVGVKVKGAEGDETEE